MLSSRIALTCEGYNGWRARISPSIITSFSRCEIHSDRTHVNLHHAPNSFDASSAVVYPNFITEEEGKSFIKEISKRMKRRKFEEGHWDSVIVGYREVELTIQDDLIRSPNSDVLIQISEAENTQPFINAIRKTRRHLEDNHFGNNPIGSIKWIPCHAIDLSKDGRLDAHVDSVKFSGDIVAGISLLSDSIMRLKPCTDEWKREQNEDSACRLSDEEGYVDLYLPTLSLYVLSGMSRFIYTHELLASGATFEFSGSEDSNLENYSKDDDRERFKINVDRDRRLSIIFRDELRLKQFGIK